jgi:hypothetical protein
VLSPGRHAPMARMFLCPDTSAMLLEATWARVEALQD